MIDPSHEEHASRLMYVGNICAQWASVEYMFSRAIWTLLRIDEDTGKIVTGGLDMLPRANMAINLAKHLKAPKEITHALTAARTAIQSGLDSRRNEAVHGYSFLMSEKPFDVHVEVHRGKGDRKRKPLPNADLWDLGTQLHAVYEQLETALGSIGALSFGGQAPAPFIAQKMRRRTSGKESHPGSNPQ